MIKIYKITDNTNGNIYIGKTEQKYLSDRIASHRWDYRSNNNRGSVSREIIKNGDYKYELIEETDDVTRERHWIINTECINKNIPKNLTKNPAEKSLINEYYQFTKSWGGDSRYYNNLLKIDTNLFRY